MIFKEWMTGHEKLFFFLKYVEEFAQRIGDERRPFAHDTWQAAYEEWENLQVAENKLRESFTSRLPGFSWELFVSI